MITGAETEQSSPSSVRFQLRCASQCVTALIVIGFRRLLNTSLVMTRTNSKKKAAQKVDKKRQQHIAVFGAAFAAVAVAAQKSRCVQVLLQPESCDPAAG